MPKLLRAGTATANNTFLYDVTSSAGITLAAAHGNHNLQTDDDIVYTPAIAETSRDGTEPAYAAGTTVQQDFPLYWFWGHQTTSLAGATTALTQAADAGAVDTARAVLKFSGVTTIDTSSAQVYMYTPDSQDTDQGETEAGATSLQASPPPVRWLRLR